MDISKQPLSTGMIDKPKKKKATVLLVSIWHTLKCPWLVSLTQVHVLAYTVWIKVWECFTINEKRNYINLLSITPYYLLCTNP